jgi:hypothetical protein
MRRVGDDLRPPEHVITPAVVGMVVDRAGEVADSAGVVLTQPDPDGPPLAALTWQRPVTVLRHDPPAGTMVRRWASVMVTWTSEDTGVREPRRPLPQSISGTAKADGRKAATER